MDIVGPLQILQNLQSLLKILFNRKNSMTEISTYKKTFYFYIMLMLYELEHT